MKFTFPTTRSNQDFDEIQQRAFELTEQQIKAGELPAGTVGYTRENFRRADGEYRDAANRLEEKARTIIERREAWEGVRYQAGPANPAQAAPTQPHTPVPPLRRIISPEEQAFGEAMDRACETDSEG